MEVKLRRDSSRIQTELDQQRVSYQRHAISLYGPLHIVNAENFIKEQRETFRMCFYAQCPQQITIDKIDVIYLLGAGGFGKVYLVKYRNTEKLYAMKVMKKQFIVENNYLSFAQNELRVLQSVNFPFCVCLQFMAQDKFNLYWLLPFISGGDMYTHLKKLKRFTEGLSVFSAGQVILALEFLHFCNLAYRDLKPENVLIDYTGYIKIADFGFTKEVKTRLYTFCGTPDYLAPEIILCLGHSKAVDYWSLGVMIFEMVKGKTPFHGDKEMETFDKIVTAQYEMPKYFSEDLKDLVRNLLQVNVTQRFGNLQNGVNDIKQHRWFSHINWLELLNRLVIPPYIPAKADDDALINFPLTDGSANHFSLFDLNSSMQSYDEHFKDF